MAKFTGHTITSDSALGDAKIQRSLRFNRANSAHLTYTPASASSDRTKITISVWVKKCENNEGEYSIFHGGTSSTERSQLRFYHSGGYDNLSFFARVSGTFILQCDTSAKFRDASAWYHIVARCDTTNGTANIYVNGQDQDLSTSTKPSGSQSLTFFNNVEHQIGERGYDGSTTYMNGYMAEMNVIQGQALDPSYFGFTDPVTGIWMPKRYEGTYGDGFYLDFSDNTSTTTLGIDKSPNGNDFTLNNFDVNDSVKDTPTNAFATLNANVYADTTFKEGSLYFDAPDTHKTAYSTIAVNSGKWYWEAKAIGGSLTKWTYGVSDVKNIGVGQVSGSNRLLAVSSGSPSDGSYKYGDAVSIYNSHLYKNGTKVTDSYQTNPSTGDIIGVALDVDAGKVWFARNGTWINGSATASTTLNPASHDTTVTTGETYVPAISGESADWQLNFGQDDSFSGTSTSQGNEDENGLGSFYYAVPSGFRALCTKNLPPNVPSIIRPEKHFKCVAYSGTGSTQKIESLEFAPDLVWVKRRNASNYHILTDTVRGAADYLVPNNSDAESVGGGNQLVNAFFKNGFQVGTENAVNNSSGTYVAWCWKAGGATTVANTDGNQTTQVSVNEEAGFSIVTYTGTGSNTNIGHGLGATPDIVITKSRSATGSWAILDTDGNSTAEYSLYLNDNGGYSSYQGGTFWNDTLPNSTVFRVSSNAATNASGVTYVAYCWRSIPGFSKFGTYIGNGNNDGPFIHTGFRPAWVTVKNTSASNNWQTWDNARETSNVMQRILEFNDDSTTDDASSNTAIDFLSNGFKHRTSFQRSNTSGATYLYMAFAEQPDMTPFDVFPNAR